MTDTQTNQSGFRSKAVGRPTFFLFGETLSLYSRREIIIFLSLKEVCPSQSHDKHEVKVNKILTLEKQRQKA